MNKNLKTLKDILHPTVSIDDSEDYDTDWNSVDINDLRDAAKEWIRELELLIGKGFSYSIELSDNDEPIVEEMIYEDDKFDIHRKVNKIGDIKYAEELEKRLFAHEKVIWWIKHFFNIE